MNSVSKNKADTSQGISVLMVILVLRAEFKFQLQICSVDASYSGCNSYYIINIKYILFLKWELDRQLQNYELILPYYIVNDKSIVGK